MLFITKMIIALVLDILQEGSILDSRRLIEMHMSKNCFTLKGRGMSVYNKYVLDPFTYDVK